MAETSREHCRLLSSIDAMLYNGQLGLEELLQNDAAEPEAPGLRGFLPNISDEKLRLARYARPVQMRRDWSTCKT